MISHERACERLGLYSVILAQIRELGDVLQARNMSTFNLTRLKASDDRPPSGLDLDQLGSLTSVVGCDWVNLVVISGWFHQKKLHEQVESQLRIKGILTF